MVTNLYPPFSRGGAENVIVRTVDELLGLGHDVFVITGGPASGGGAGGGVSGGAGGGAGGGVTKDINSAARVYRFFPKNIYFTLDDYKYPKVVRLIWHLIDAISPHGMRVVRDILDAERPDVVISHNLKGLGLRIPRIIQRYGFNHTHILHDLQLIYPSGLLMYGKERDGVVMKIVYGLYSSYCRWALGNPDTVISPSEYLREVYLKRGFFSKSGIKLLRNPAPEHELVQRALSPEGPVRLLYVGQLAEHKGLRILFEAVWELGDRVNLVVAGDGPMREELLDACVGKEGIRILGFIVPSELPRLFESSEEFVVPSLCY